MLLLTGAHVFGPEDLGRNDLLIAGGKIAGIAPHIEWRSNLPLDICDLKGQIVVPGFIDAHIHIAGGGGEGGFQNRTPEIFLSHLTTAGITTVVGVLGTDGTTRSVSSLLAKARGLEAEGISTFIYSGAYQVPEPTVTGSIRSDIILIDKVIGCGEVAISDHRSSFPSEHELARLASEARVGGLIGGKAGIVHLHVGEDPQGIAPILAVADHYRLPIKQLVPTHLNRNPRLLGQALDFGLQGGMLDLTSGIQPDARDGRPVKPSRAIRFLLEGGVEPAQITMSSDGNGSIPSFDSEGHLLSLRMSSAQTLWEEARAAVLEEKVPLPTALSIITFNVAQLLHFACKGKIAANMDADLVVLDQDMEIKGVMASGQWMVKEGQPTVFGTFEQVVDWQSTRRNLIVPAGLMSNASKL